MNTPSDGKAPFPYQPEMYARLAQTPLGVALWAFLNTPENLIRLETATYLRRPALEGVERRLLEEFGENLANDQVKRMVGHMTRQVMEHLGFELDAKDVRMTGVPFGQASRYKKSTGFEVHAYSEAKAPRSLALVRYKTGSTMTLDGREWVFWKTFDSKIALCVGATLTDVATALRNIDQHGVHFHRMERVLRAGASTR